MNRIAAMLVVIAAVFVAADSVYAQGQSPRWKYYSTDGGHNDHYYDRKSKTMKKIQG
jgi:hypothetical protein